MTVIVKVECDDCPRYREEEAEKCLCESCLEDIKKNSYDEGYKQGQKDKEEELKED